ncbi:MAG: GGDEF domain-containing response regulator [Candidatus Scalindua sp.]|jgi:diguanylate cyclase (GGDEF)-like protein|nr:GGDEF domain-containing response regulator [Candidatus Scalindua sp.]MBT6226224.1 GGDEF domain-containing response regulator [Candidatus Scalindua sp.]MBT7590504.1 GGDEF domain-containing response regulator [Candidatus Scalindua sp.]
MMKCKILKVLLIEDNPDNATLIHEELNDACGNTMELVVEVKLLSGLKCIASGNIDIVLLDLSLPDSKGYNTFIRTRAFAPQLPIIVLSGNSDKSLAVKMIRAGAQDFLVKGQLDIEVLVRSMHYAVERQKAMNGLQSMLLIDRVTGLHNRRGLLIHAEQQIILSKREKRKFFVLLVDINNTKLINDTEGDLSLLETANILRKTIREPDIVGRIDSNEFVVIPIEAHKNSVGTLHNRLLKNVQTYNSGNKNNFDLSVRVRVAYFDPDDPVTFEELLTHADALKHEQKKVSIKS